MHKITGFFRVTLSSIIIGLVISAETSAVEIGPTLISEVPPNQLYNESDILAIKDSAVKEFKSGGQNSLTKEYVLYQEINSIDPQSLTTEQLSFLKSNTKHQTEAFKRHPEGPIAVPVFDIASLARYKLFLHQVELEKEQLNPIFNSSLDTFAQKSLESPATIQASKALLAESNDLSLLDTELLINSYKTANHDDALPLLFALVEQKHSLEAAKAVLQSSFQSPLKHQLLSNLDKYFSAEQRETLLREHISAKSKLSSQALAEYGKLPQSVIKTELLYANLSDPSLGASSAFALANVLKKSSDVSILKSHLQHKKKSRLHTANTLLALKLADTAASRQLLQEALEQDYVQFDDMKAEVKTWLK